jgi:hypothetical protein
MTTLVFMVAGQHWTKRLIGVRWRAARVPVAFVTVLLSSQRGRGRGRGGHGEIGVYYSAGVETLKSGRAWWQTAVKWITNKHYRALQEHHFLGNTFLLINIFMAFLLECKLFLYEHAGHEKF